MVPEHGGDRAARAPVSHGGGAERRGGGGGKKGGKARGGAAVGGGGAAAASVVCELECLESAVACVGRAQAHLSPLIADPTGGRVPEASLLSAELDLKRAAAALRKADPDRPIAPTEWFELVHGRSLVDCPITRLNAVEQGRLDAVERRGYGC